MKKLILPLFLLLSISGFTQNSNSTTDEIALSNGKTTADTSIFLIVERAPDFPGGAQAMTKYIQDSLRYPKDKSESEITGTCYVGFIVEKDGTVTQVSPMRSIAGAPLFNEECLRIVRKMPNWNPGKQNGRPVRVRFVLPIKKGLSK